MCLGVSYTPEKDMHKTLTHCGLVMLYGGIELKLAQVMACDGNLKMCLPVKTQSCSMSIVSNLGKVIIS